MTAPDFRTIFAVLREHPLTSRWQRVTDIPERDRGATLALIMVCAVSPGAAIDFDGDQLSRLALLGADNYAGNREHFDRMTMLDAGTFAMGAVFETVASLAEHHPDILAAITSAPIAKWEAAS